MQLSLLNYDQVVANMTAAIQSTAAAGGFTITMKSGSLMLAMVQAAAGVYLWLQWLVVLVLSASRLSTSTGTDVDSFCGADFQCLRLPGVAASGQATFSRYSTLSAATIAVGSIVKTTDGTQSFAVLADPTNAAWVAPSVSYPLGSFVIAASASSVVLSVANTQVGVAGNIIAGALGLVVSVIQGVDTVTNSAAFTNGMNAESDAAYKARFALFLIALAQSTPIAVQSAVLGVAQNLTCAVLNAVATIGGAFAPGYFVAAIDDGSGATPAATITTAQAAVNAVEGLGLFGTVVQATVETATIALTITCASSAIKTATQPIVQQALSSAVGAIPVATTPASGAPPNGVLPFWRIGQIAFDASPNVLNVSGVTLNGGTSDIGGAPGTVVRLGSVTVS